MTRIPSFILAFCAFVFSSTVLRAADEPSAVAEKFYAGYVAEVEANKDTKVWVAKSKLASEKFKKAYAKAMNSDELDADPVLNAQDIPDKPFKAQKPVIKDDKATVVLNAGSGEYKHSVTVKLVKTDGVWLLDAVNE
ncbi:YbjP/YqhG family protein [Luteolibacter sp. GHJ8]|uniref:YbjP/YqhG family protein n=1 Tax=Luteolibacter rhizosphaerae TaxID=2989719 RepID=A0ABT3G6Z6_9BACT|nr:YbjP/YqhG family protein [Luteolibacter rhizosphaerae]MCW1915618.1 YbjP/YqhG family protein [Luteolibacter rhizosphaerae]